MAGTAPGLLGEVSARGRRFGIVASRFHEAITTKLAEGAHEALRRHGARERDITVVWVPGAFEIPQAALRLARRGGVDALICVGCVIRGETPHFEYLAAEAARGIGDVGRLTGIPVTFGVITAETMTQARDRAGGRIGNRGEEAALAALELDGLWRALGSGRAVRTVGGGSTGTGRAPRPRRGTRKRGRGVRTRPEGV